jgi:hypothetical protein
MNGDHYCVLARERTCNRPECVMHGRWSNRDDGTLVYDVELCSLLLCIRTGGNALNVLGPVHDHGIQLPLAL